MISHEKIPARLWEDLIYLSEVFMPGSFAMYENDTEKRRELVQSFYPIAERLAPVAGERPAARFESFRELLPWFSPDDCAAYLLRHLRNAVSQGGGESFIAKWKDGSAEALVQRFMACLDYMKLPDAPEIERQKPEPVKPDFDPEETVLLEGLLRQCMGMSPAEEGWSVSVNAYPFRIIWSSGWGVDGYDYCGEDDHTVYAEFTVPRTESAAGFEVLEDFTRVLRLRGHGHCLDGLCFMIRRLRAMCGRVLIKDTGSYDDPEDARCHVNAEAEFIFEGLRRDGRALHLLYRDMRTSQF